jgi:type III secretory pathway component EscV
MELNSLVKEYLKAHGLQETLDTFDAEINEKISARNSRPLQEQLQINKVPKTNQDLAKMPLIY